MDEFARYRWIDANALAHEREVRGWLRRHVRSLSTADIDDLIQEAYARLWLADFERIDDGRRYFYSVVRNVLLEQARRARIVPMERMGEIDSLRFASEEPGPDRHFSGRQEVQRLQRVISTLPPQCRRAFELQRFSEMSTREVAGELGISIKTVEKHLSKALSRVIAVLTAEERRGEPTDIAEDAEDHERRHEQDR